MRVTNRMLANNYLRNMNKNLTNMQTLNRQLSTGKEISRPSDNPYKTARSMGVSDQGRRNSRRRTGKNSGDWKSSYTDHGYTRRLERKQGKRNYCRRGTYYLRYSQF